MVNLMIRNPAHMTSIANATWSALALIDGAFTVASYGAL